MFNFVAHPVVSGAIAWQDLSNWPGQEDEGVIISFNLSARHTRRRAMEVVAAVTAANNVEFIKFVGNRLWEIDFDLAKEFFKNEQFRNADWAYSSITCEAEVEVHRDNFDNRETTTLSFHFSRQELLLLIDQKIFLSHKGANKPLVRDTARLLADVGFQPWLDEDAMQAGANLERALLEGMKQSCAAVFFVTPEYVDENYLATEVEYAIQQKRAKKDRFAIITIVLTDTNGKKGRVPELLRHYVWKEPANDIQMLDEIIKAVPIKPSGITWK